MGFTETADLVARLTLKDQFSGVLKKIEGNTKKSASIMRGALSTAIGVGLQRAAVRGASIVLGQVRSGLDSLAELESATTSVDGAIKQMGLTGQVTSGQIAGWANEIEANIEAAFDDKDITQAATTLIRFGKVTPQNLKPALTVIADLATKTGSVESAATLLAKALADPEKAAGKLARTGVILTKAQQNQIKAMVKTGDVAGAQALILDAVATATKDAAKAMNGPFVDSQKVLADVVEDAQRALATGFLPVLMEVRDILSTELAKPATLDNIKRFGEGLAGGLHGLIDVARGLPWTQIGDSLKVAAAGGKTLLDAITSLPPWIQTAVLTGWGLNKLTGGAVLKIGVELVSGAAEGLFKQFFARGATPANPLFVSDITGGKGGLPGVPGAAAAGGASLIGAVSVLPAITALLTGFLADQANNDPTKQRLGIGTEFKAVASPFDPAFWTNLGGVIETVIKGNDDRNKPPLAIDPRGLSEGNRELVDAVDNSRNAQESARIAIVSAQTTSAAGIVSAIGMSEGNIARGVKDARDAIETARIAQVSATLTGGAGIVAAIGAVPPAIARDTGDAIGRSSAQTRDAVEASRIALTTQLGATRDAVDLGKAATDRARDAVEASRIALSTKLGEVRTGVDNTKAATDRARDAIESSRITLATELGSTRGAIVGGGHSDTDRIVGAIKAIDLSVKVFVDKGDPGSRTKVVTGGTVAHATATPTPTGVGHSGQ